MIKKIIKTFTSTCDTSYVSILKEVEAKIFQTFYSQFKVQQIDINKNLIDYNIDSLQRIEFIVQLEQKFAIDILDEEVLKIESVNDCIVIFNKYIVEKLNRDKLILYDQDNQQLK